MSVDLSKLATEILQRAWECVKDNLDTDDEENSVLSESVRLLALNEILSAWAYNKLDAPSALFHEISLTGKMNSVDARRISEILTDHRCSLHQSKLEHVHPMSILKLADLLGIVHSIGAHTLPPRGYSQRRLYGAYYTPSDVALFIAEKSLEPILKKGDVSDLLERISNIKILDPCCGSGIFLAASYSILTKSLSYLSMIETESEEVCDLLATHHYGVDLDPAALEISSCILSIMAGDSSFKRYRSQMHRGNSLVNSLRLSDGSRIHEFNDFAISRDSFEWQREFCEILQSGGFDVILFNPPYKRLRPNQAEYMRTRLRSDSRVDMNEFIEHKKQLREEIQFFRNSGEYFVSVFGSINTYQLFIERALNLSKEGGQIGFIVPSTLLADYSTRKLRKYLLHENQVKQLYEFPEATRLFSGVTQSLCIGHIQKGGSTQRINAIFSLSSLEEAKTPRFLKMSVADIHGSFGNSFVIPRTSKDEWDLVKKIHRHPAISAADWLYNHRGELDLTLDKKFIMSGHGTYPLIRGSSIGRYRLRGPLDHISEHVDLLRFKKSKGTSDRIRHIEGKRIACQQVSNQANHWRMKFSSIPANVVLSNSCNYLSIKPGTPQFVLDYLLGVMNSELLNWRFSLSSSNNHVSNRELAQLPLVDPLDPTNGPIVYEIASLVKAIKSPMDVHNTKLEALVFSLFGFKKNEMKRILQIRHVSSGVIDETMDSF